jgi:hypothetical protein
MCDREVYKKRQGFCNPELIFKKPRGTDCSLELASMKEEWLVIANHYVAVNVADIMYTSPVVPRELFGLKMGKVHFGKSLYSFVLLKGIKACADYY